ncbi:16S rRNA m(7)G-527 methyltransferase [Desulfonispora thiosulfatigenes DSM 11270]|uniref:Ribosomal RNA small subunit methyltransferase G n=1 Tax=Desulfonispora thiosulfatigenes DSM 11270 TaxID=656914 RepID=A0A1W1V2K4_DESTI|nr:16S rRNA (guanine(527)-N(7))-methyltransferase RsmG [Desulfonispora thiosulfatigenes]SMB87552.1 16S rRNA m(7)G-527 methyltransferase [Desulfonispora thiosulfatigenes DSM 11270]
MQEKLKRILTEEQIEFTGENIIKLTTFMDLLQEWNKKMNLTAIESDEEIMYKHFLDSLLCLKVWDKWENKKIIDIGTGAGFPGIPLKIFEDSIKIDLLDSLNKRLVFLENVIENLSLTNVNVIHGRAEDYGKDIDYRQGYDLVLARAVANLPILLEFCLPFVKVGGHFIALKGPEVQEELTNSEKALETLGGKYVDSKSFSLMNGQHQRNIMIFEKIFDTPDKYPRKAGIPKKRPIIK